MCGVLLKLIVFNVLFHTLINNTFLLSLTAALRARARARAPRLRGCTDKGGALHAAVLLVKLLHKLVVLGELALGSAKHSVRANGADLASVLNTTGVRRINILLSSFIISADFETSFLVELGFKVTDLFQKLFLVSAIAVRANFAAAAS